MKRLARLVGLSRRPKLPPFEGPVRVMVFDFDGTIADTFQQGLDILNGLAAEFGYKPLAGDDVEKARGMTTRQVMRFLGIPNRRLPAIASRGIRELRARIGEVRPIAGVPEVLRALRARGIRLGIVTSNSEENVGIFLKHHDLEIFEFVRSSSRLLGKAREIRQAMKRDRFGAEEVLFVGDETRDIEACRRARIRCAAVTWGYNLRESLLAQDPYCIFDRPEELLSVK
ncbi:MAG TPA: HAD-IA family hydrolase [Chthoniobacterales bacterium]|nr:HAD-IA family hydrolase [Chthoniobacterales bacterium]